MLWGAPLQKYLHMSALGIVPGYYFLCFYFHRSFMVVLCALVKGDLENLCGFLAS